MRTLTIAVLAVAAIAAGGAVAVSATSAASGNTTLTLTAKPTGGTPIDLGPKGTSLGDQFLEHGSLRRASGGRVGDFQLTAQLASGSPRRGTETTAMTLHLPGGEIVAEGDHALVERYVVPVTGGSGRYAGAGGTIRTSPAGGESTRLTIHLTH
jgi:hypothetical protein